MKIEVFGKQGCAICQTTKNKLAHLVGKWGVGERVELSFVDLDTVDGMAEGAFHDVIEIPTTIVSDNGTVLARWEHEIPASEDLRKALERCDCPASK